MSDLTGSLRLLQSLQGTAGRENLLQTLGVRVMKLVQVNRIRPEIFQADVNVPGHGFFILGAAFGGQDELVPNPLQAVAQVFLADGVGSGTVDVVDSCRRHGLQKLPGSLPVNPLHRDAAQTHPGHFQAGFS